MALVCAQCSRVNPADAAYCYHDGAALAGRADGPINPGSAPFPTPFVFPNGLACRNFDQLAMTCQQNWVASLELLKQGFLASFFGGLGRVDLALAAQEAAKFPDPDRGLDQLLGKLPSQVVEAPKLHAEPTEVNLGQIRIGTDRTIELHLSNRGMRLLYGSVASDSKWLTLGEAPGQPQKVFQFGDETIVHVQIRGQHLRAGARTLEGQLVIDSNGGTVNVTVRADVPVTPYVGGLFDGAITPRQIAEKAKANPKETASYFEDGRVATWFQSNGWTYPVVGPSMSGMGAVQQFFEALGVAKPPQVQIGPPSFRFDGEPGKVFEVAIDVSSAERKVVYGWATSDRSWIAVGKTKLTNKGATIPITVTVPDQAGTQQAKLTVVGNGQQRFTVPVTMAVIGGAEVLDAEIIAEPETLEAQLVEQPVLAAAASIQPASVQSAIGPPASVRTITPSPTRPPSTPTMSWETPPAVAPVPQPILKPATPATVPTASQITATAPLTAPQPLIGSGFDPTATFGDVSAPAPSRDEDELSVGTPGLMHRPAAMIVPPKRGLQHRWSHFIPLAVLLVALFATLARDVVVTVIRGFAPPVSEVDSRPMLGLDFDFKFDKGAGKGAGSTMMAGLVRYDPELGKGAEPKKLTYDTLGRTNSVVIRIDGKDLVFGNILNGRYSSQPANAGPYPGKKCTFEFTKERIQVTQEVRIIPGDPIEVSPEVNKRLLDTCLFRYTIVNKDPVQRHTVGLRFLLDTFIGNNDGVPFTLPGVPGLVDTFRELKGDEIPDFIQVLENPDLEKPGLIAQLNLRLGAKYRAPDLVRLTAHPLSQNKEGVTKESWDIPLAEINELHDSCVAMYWEPAELASDQSREMAFTYGLGSVSIGKSAKLGLTVGGAPVVGREMTVVALVADPQPGQTVELQLPKGLVLTSGKAVQPVPESAEKNKDGKLRPSPVTWRIRAAEEKSFRISIESRFGNETVTQERTIVVRGEKLF